MAFATHRSQECITPGETAPVTHPGASLGAEGGPDDETEDLGASTLDPGVYVGRYRIIDVVGSGDIGVVYAALDEDLGRSVALKLVRPTTQNPRKRQRRRARLVREAQALARLSHPNVVPIYEVGMFEDRVFIAMEYVEGSTMRRWLRRSSRSWEEILDKFVQAGRGLVAAHAEDIVHRDFKPDNALVGNDGRVRVLDFGLATPVPDAPATGRYLTVAFEDVPTGRERTKSGPQRLTDSVSALITAHGKVMGTPAYMAPEQSRGDAIDARADQYSFCVALWEALFGERPQGPPTATGRIRLHRRLSERGLSGKDVPPHIQRALERGLSLDPADRFPSMKALLEALAPPQASWRRRLLLLAAAAAAVLAGGVALAATLSSAPAPSCIRTSEALAGVWDAELQAQIGARLGATALPHASATRETVTRQLDRWAERWLDAELTTCQAAAAPAGPSAAVLEAQRACLTSQLEAVAAVTHSLALAEPSEDPNHTLEAALAAVLELPDPQRCQRDARRARAGVGAEANETLAQQRQLLARAHGLVDAAAYAEALALVDELLADSANAGPHGFPALAEARLIRGRVLASTGKLDAATQELREAVFAAQTSGQDAVGVDACTALAELLIEEAELVRADDWLTLGRATLARIGGDTQLETNLRLASARLASARGQHELALADQDRVLQLREELHGPDHPAIAEVLRARALSHTGLGQHHAAARDMQRALDILTSQLGPTHPEVGLAYLQSAALLRSRGAQRRALSQLHDARAIFEIAYDQEHPRIVETYATIAQVHDELGEPDKATAAREYARRVARVVYGEGHPKLDALTPKN